MAAETEIEIPTSWVQRFTRAQLVTIMAVLIGAGAWCYSVNGDLITLKERLARTEEKLESLKENFQERDRKMSNELVRVSTMLEGIEKRLISIDRNVKVMAQ